MRRITENQHPLAVPRPVAVLEASGGRAGRFEKGNSMSEKRIVVWVQHFSDRPYLMLQWHDPDTGKRKSKSAETNNPIEAEQKRDDLQYELNHGLYKEASRMGWDVFRAKFEAEYVAGTRLNTRENYTATFDLFERLCKPMSLKGINERTISHFVAGMRKEPGRRKGTPSMMSSTIKGRLQLLHTALSWAVKQKMLAEVPEFPAIKVPKKKPQPIPQESFERLVGKTEDEQLKTYMLCGWLAGLRLSEAHALEWQVTDKAPYIDFRANRIILPAEFVKADEDQWVPLDPELRQALEALPRHGRRVFRFLDRRSRLLSANAISQKITKLARRAGVKLTMHSLRKGFGCRYANKESAHVLQRLMRHASLQMTMDYYVNIDEAVDRAVLGDVTSHVTDGPVQDELPNEECAINPYHDDTNIPSAD